jgi:hypothetical protein
LTLSVEADLDRSSDQLTWTFTSLDPDTGELTEDPLAGFLPPNRTPPEGEGYVMFTIRQKPDLPTGREIRNRASIVFDTNAPIDTGEVLNTIDAGPPSSEVLPLEETQTDTDFLVSWTGQDDEGGSGIRDFSIYASTDDSPYEVWLANTTETSATFSGEHEHTYGFYSRATDNVGHVEAAPVIPDATTTIAATTVPWYLLTVSVISGEGTVSPSEGTFAQGTDVTLTATPAEGYEVGDWSGVDDSDGEMATVTMNSDRTVTVTFAPVEPGRGIPPALPSGAMCGACGSGASAAMIMSLCVLGFARFRRRCKD